MTRYLIFERSDRPGEDAVFLRDRFYIVAFLLPFVWFAAHKLYFVSALALVVQIAIALLGNVEGFGIASVALSLLLGTGVALEGPRLVAARLRQRGYCETAIIYAGGLDEAELLYHGTDPQREKVETRATDFATLPALARSGLPVFGWRSARTLLDAGPR